MKDNDKRFLDEKLLEIRLFWEAEVRSVESSLKLQLQNLAKAKIAAIRADMEAGIEKAGDQYRTAMAKASSLDDKPELAFLADQMRKSAKRQLEILVQGYKDITEQAIRSIRKLAE